MAPSRQMPNRRIVQAGRVISLAWMTPSMFVSVIVIAGWFSEVGRFSPNANDTSNTRKSKSAPRRR